MAAGTEKERALTGLRRSEWWYEEIRKKIEDNVEEDHAAEGQGENA